MGHDKNTSFMCFSVVQRDPLGVLMFCLFVLQLLVCHCKFCEYKPTTAVLLDNGASYKLLEPSLKPTKSYNAAAFRTKTHDIWQIVIKCETVRLRALFSCGRIVGALCWWNDIFQKCREGYSSPASIWHFGDSPCAEVGGEPQQGCATGKSALQFWFQGWQCLALFTICQLDKLNSTAFSAEHTVLIMQQL